MDKSQKRFYTVKQVAKIMGICLSIAYERLRTGEIPVGFKLGRRWLIPKVRFDEWWGDHGKIQHQPTSGRSTNASDKIDLKDFVPLLAFRSIGNSWRFKDSSGRVVSLPASSSCIKLELNKMRGQG